MTTIILTNEQAELIKKAGEEVEIRTPEGERLGVFRAQSEDEVDIEIALQRRASGGPYVTTAEVLAHLASLQDRESKSIHLRSFGTMTLFER